MTTDSLSAEIFVNEPAFQIGDRARLAAVGKLSLADFNKSAQERRPGSLRDEHS
jgi:hypothetical protein